MLTVAAAALLLFALPTYAHDHDHMPMNNSVGMAVAMGFHDVVPTLWNTRLALHALGMCLLMFIALPIGIIFAIQRRPIHKYWQTAVIAGVWLAAIPALKDVGADGGTHGESAHATLGLLTLSLFTLQLLVGWFTKLCNMFQLAGYEHTVSGEAEHAPVNACVNDQSTTHHPFFYSLRSRLSWFAAHPRLSQRIRWLSALSHRLLAYVLCLLVSFTLIFGFVHVQNVNDEESGNYTAHLSFGIPIVLGGMTLPLCGTPNKRLTVEYSVWLLFGTVIVASQHDWMSDGLSNMQGDLQHVMIGGLATISSFIGLLFLTLKQRYGLALQPLLLAVPAAMLYLMLGSMMFFHSQSTEYGIFIHRAYALQMMAIAALGLVVAATENEQETTVANHSSRDGSHSPVVSEYGHVRLHAEEVEKRSTQAHVYEQQQLQPGATANLYPSLTSNTQQVTVLPTDVAHHCDTPRISRCARLAQNLRQLSAWYQLRSLALVMGGVTFSGSAYANIRNAAKMLHPPMYVVVLLLIALVLYAWWNIMVAAFVHAFNSRECKAAAVPHHDHELQLTAHMQHSGFAHAHTSDTSDSAPELCIEAL